MAASATCSGADRNKFEETGIWKRKSASLLFYFFIFCEKNKLLVEIENMRANYATVKIPMDLADKLDTLVSDMGYRSRAEIVNDAIRRFIDERARLKISDYPANHRMPMKVKIPEG